MKLVDVIVKTIDEDANVLHGKHVQQLSLKEWETMKNLWLNYTQEQMGKPPANSVNFYEYNNAADSYDYLYAMADDISEMLDHVQQMFDKEWYMDTDCLDDTMSDTLNALNRKVHKLAEHYGWALKVL